MAGDGDTIFALASGAGRAAIAVIRLSGAESRAIFAKVAGALPAPRRASVRALRTVSGEVLDRAMVLWLPGPGTYTGEDSAELHVHGGRAVVEAATDALVAAGARPAEPGEFSRRAFVQGRMGLLEAEAIADLVAAETAAQRQQALRQMQGEQSDKIAAWSERLRRLLAWQEALIDFPEEDLPIEVEQSLVRDLSVLLAEIRLGLAEAAGGIRVRDGIVVAVSGAPNVGKSSLVNRLACRDVAIVSPLPGTTRDALEVTIELGGLPVTLVDTAGLRDTDDPLEAEGVRRARARAASADLVLEVVDATMPAADTDIGGVPKIRVANKIDLAASPGVLGVSALTGASLDELRLTLGDMVTALTHASANPVFTRARHAAALTQAVIALEGAQANILPELRGEELRIALAALGRITGSVDAEMVLDLVFSQFCIGK